MSKRKWKKPKLVVLVKGRPEEAVLCACKSGGGGPVASALSCMEDKGSQGCVGCSDFIGT